MAKILNIRCESTMETSVCNLHKTVERTQDIPPMLICERCNTIVSKQFSEMLPAVL